MNELEQNGWDKWQKFVLLELKRYGEQFKAITTTQVAMKDALQEYNMELRLHIRGVRALERRNDLLQEDLNKFKGDVESRLQVAEAPVKWAQVTGSIFKWIVYLSGSAGAGYALFKFIGG